MGKNGMESTIMTVMLGELVNVDKMAACIAKKYISLRVNDDDKNMAVLCYTRRAQWKGMWTRETLTSRGLIVTTSSGWPSADDHDGLVNALSTAKVMSRGMSKFFTLEQAQDSDYGSMKLMDDDENLIVDKPVKIELDSPAIISDKLDGMLGVSYIASDGMIALASKASFDYKDCVRGTRLLRSNHDAKGMADAFDSGVYQGKTPIFEIIMEDSMIDEDKRHVCSYDYSDPVFLGMVDDATGRWEPAVEYVDYADRFGLRTPEPMIGTLRGALKLPDLDDHEGVVVTISNTDGSQTMMKVKYPRFLKLQQLKNRSHKSEITRWMRSLTFGDLKAINGPDDVPLSTIMRVNYDGIEWSGSDVKTRVRSMIWRKYVDVLKKSMIDIGITPSDAMRLNDGEMLKNKKWRRTLNDLHYYSNGGKHEKA